MGAVSGVDIGAAVARVASAGICDGVGGVAGAFFLYVSRNATSSISEKNF